MIAGEITRVKEEFPQKTILVGGPGLTQNSMNHKPGSSKNWYIRFIQDITKKNIQADFISMHFYGSAGNRNEFQQRLQWLYAAMQQSGQRFPVWITEWGTSAFFQQENENFSPAAGAFSLEFLSTAARNGVARCVFIASTQHPDTKKQGPALMLKNGQPSHALTAIQAIRQLEGSALDCETGNPDYHCLASRKAQQLSILVWRSNWSHRRMGGDASSLTRFFFTEPVVSRFTVNRFDRKPWQINNVRINGNDDHTTNTLPAGEWAYAMITAVVEQ
jgi:hypothetical protein